MWLQFFFYKPANFIMANAGLRARRCRFEFLSFDCNLLFANRTERNFPVRRFIMSTRHRRHAFWRPKFIVRCSSSEREGERAEWEDHRETAINCSAQVMNSQDSQRPYGAHASNLNEPHFFAGQLNGVKLRKIQLNSCQYALINGGLVRLIPPVTVLWWYTPAIGPRFFEWATSDIYKRSSSTSGDER